MWGQDYSGVYYIVNDNSGGNNSGSTDTTPYSSATDNKKWYLVPADNSQQASNHYIDAYFSSNHNSTDGNSEQPFLTTYQTNKDAATVPTGVTERANNSIWIVKKTSDGYYNVIHVATGKYVIYEVPLPNDPDKNTETNEGDNGKRKTMHLQTPDDENGTGTYRLSSNENFKFTITRTGNTEAEYIYRFQPKRRSGWYWNPANGNRNSYSGIKVKNSIYQGGLVGVYNVADDGGSKWRFDDPTFTAPTISDYDLSTQKVTITETNGLPPGYNIRYTFSSEGNPDDPTATTTTYIVNTEGSANEIEITEPGTLKVVIERYGVVLTEVAEKEIIKVATPTITNDGTNITINCATAGATIYYTTNGSDDPLTSVNKLTYTDPLTVSEHLGETIRAIAVMEGCFNSEEGTPLFVESICPMPNISFSNSNGEITLTGSDVDAIYYTLDGITTPDPTQVGEGYPTKLYDPDHKPTIEATTTIKAIATKSPLANSNVAEKTFEQLVAPSFTFDGTSLLVTITPNSTVEGVSTVYTVNNDNPTTTSAAYIEPIAITANTTVKAMNVKEGYVNSEIASLPVDLSTTGYAGIYYLQNQNNTNHYLYPADKDAANIFYVKTAQNRKLSAVWKLSRYGNSNYYYIIHYKDGKYLKADGNYPVSNAVTLVTTTSPDDNCLFEFKLVPNETDIYNIKPKGASRTDNKNFLAPNDGVGKNIGLNTGDAALSKWKLINVPIAPSITVNDINVTFTNNFGSGGVYYTYQINSAPADPTKTATAASTNLPNLQLQYGPHYYIKAVTIYDDKGDNLVSSVTETNFQVNLVSPQFTVTDNVVTITNSQASGVTFRYTLSDDGNEPADPVAPSGAGTDGASVSLTSGKRYIIKAIAYNTVESTTYKSAIATIIVDLRGATSVSSYADIDSPTGRYKLSSSFTANESDRKQVDGKTIGSSAMPFKGTIEGYIDETTGEIKPISLSKPLFDYVEDATIKNIVVKQGSISGTDNGSGNVGAIAGNASGRTRIYNCGVLGSITSTKNATTGEVTYTYGSEISGTTNVGSIVGLLNGTSRVINCFSFAKIMSGSNKGGIVGNNNYSASKSGDIQTMVMNCMFYGDIVEGDNISPVYGGYNINNVSSTGLNTYNYYRYESYYSKKKKITTGKYNCALAAKEKYLTRFEIYRQLLNSNRKLAAWYAIGDANKGLGENNEMAKWVLDKSIAPYPILKKQGYYPSVVNYDPDNTFNKAGTKVSRSSISIRSQGGYIKKNGLVQELEVKISLGSGAPTGASIKSDKKTIKLKRIDKDTLNYNFNYDKVQLPYFNEVGVGNYGLDSENKSRVVTGWKITSLSGGTEGTYKEGSDIGTDDITPYNFADRNCTNKDLYDEGDAGSDRVFSQGAYFDVPYGVTSINIEPYWGYAAYISDPYYDVVYNTSYTGATNVVDMGTQGNSLLASGLTIHTTVSSALSTLSGVSNAKVYDYALVLVGNLHLNSVPSTGATPFTIMSADFDKDNEPDYSLIYSHPGRDNGAVSEIRFDFVNIPGTAMAQKPNGAPKFYNISIFKPKGWFEVTNTCQLTIVQFEYDNGGKSAAPLIFLGGEYEQIVSTKTGSPTVTQYIHVGSNAYFKEFNNGTHSDGYGSTKHIPISATGGDYDKFYLSGAYRPDAAVATDNAEGYISGGRFGEVAGAGQQQIDGNVYWQIYDADIREFYGGGINSDKPITGNIVTDIYNSHVKTYCGGPKFGDMQKKTTETQKTIITYATNQAGTTTATREVTIDKDRTVTSTATGCVFDNYYGAGYGGIAYVRKRTQDDTTSNFATWQSDYTNNKGKYFDGATTSIGTANKREVAGPGVAVDFDYEFFVWSTGETGGRFYNKYASLSFATTNNVESTLTNCIIKENFYGGGNLGKVDGTIKSTLYGCEVAGNVFGAGFSAQKPKVPYRDGGFTATGVPSVDTEAGVFSDGVKSSTIINLELTSGTLTNNTLAITPTTAPTKIYTAFTDAELKNLGTVSGKVTLNIGGKTVVEGKTFMTDDDGKVIVDESGNRTVKEQVGGVFGGGDSSAALNDTEVNIQATSLKDGYDYNINNVYGGGNNAAVSGNSTVTLAGNTDVKGDVFGGGNNGEVSGTATVKILETLPSTSNTGN